MYNYNIIPYFFLFPTRRKRISVRHQKVVFDVTSSSAASLPAETAAICQGLTPTLGSSLFGSLGARVKLSSHVKNKNQPTSVLREIFC